MLDSIGWVATAIFASSYFCKQPGTLRRIQALAAFLWIGYGILIHAAPVIVANLVVAAVALYSSFRRNPPLETVQSGLAPEDSSRARGLVHRGLLFLSRRSESPR
jgi:Bacterial inner membrane protein